MTNINSIEVYTDGSHKGRYGAWAFVMVCDGVVITEASSRAKKTSSNRMEFQAAIEALKALPLKSTVILHSDSRILIDTMNLWRSDWKANSWVKKNGRPIPNVDQIIELDSLSEGHAILWKWVKAHAGNVHNERCDELCTLERSSQ